MILTLQKMEIWRVEQKLQTRYCSEISPLSVQCWEADFCHGVDQGFGFFFFCCSHFLSLINGKERKKKILPFYLWYEIIFPNPWLCARLNPAAKFPVKAKHPVACLYYLSEDMQVQRGWEGRITWSNANRDFLFYANVLIVVWERGICGDVWIQPVCRNKIWCHSTCICNSA